MQGANWKDVAELIGITAIVASLIFVGLQMKQSQEIAIAAQYHQRAALTVDSLNAELEAGDLRFWGRDQLALRRLSGGELSIILDVGVLMTMPDLAS